MKSMTPGQQFVAAILLLFVGLAVCVGIGNWIATGGLGSMSGPSVNTSGVGDFFSALGVWAPRVCVGFLIVLALIAVIPIILRYQHWRLDRQITTLAKHDAMHSIKHRMTLREIEAEKEAYALRFKGVELADVQRQAANKAGLLELDRETHGLYDVHRREWIWDKRRQRVQPTPAAEEEIPEAEIIQGLPHAPAFKDMKRELSPGKIIFGYGHGGPVTGELDDFLSTGVMGLPKAGKSTTLFYLIAQLLMNHAHIICWDPSNGLIRLKSLMTMIDLEGMPSHAEIVRGILNQRLAELAVCLEKDEDYLPPPLVLVIDELPAIAERFEKGEDKHPNVMAVIRKCVMEGRKVRIFIVLAGQSFAAKQMDGSMLKNNLYCRYVLDCVPLEAMMAGLDLTTKTPFGKLNNQFLPMIRGKRGVAILDRREGGAVPEIVAIPHTTVTDVAGCVRVVDGSLGYALPSVTRQITSGTAVPACTQSTFPPDIEEAIRRYTRAGKSQRYILRELQISHRLHHQVGAIIKDEHIRMRRHP